MFGMRNGEVFGGVFIQRDIMHGKKERGNGKWSALNVMEVVRGEGACVEQ